jgi:hypothetical protein
MLQYLDMDRCASLSRIHESVGALAKLSFISLRDCTNLVGITDTVFNKKKASFKTKMLDMFNPWSKAKLDASLLTYMLKYDPTNLPVKSLIYLDLSFCNISTVPDAIGELKSLERLNLQGNKFTSIPSTFSFLQNLSYLNLSHCHMLQSFPELPTKNGPSDLVGRYFETTSESHNHRSGLYIFDSPNCMELILSFDAILDFFRSTIGWMQRLVEVRNTFPTAPRFLSLF